MTDSSSIPDKCDFCGLRVRYEHTLVERLTTQSVMDDFAQLHILEKHGIIDNVPPRKMLAVIGGHRPDSTSFCAVNSSAWNNRQQQCRYWTLKIRGATLADYLAIYHSQRNNLIAIGFSVVAIVVSVVLAIVGWAT